jgi:hypothetical protein
VTNGARIQLRHEALQKMKRSNPLWDFTELVAKDRREKMLALSSFDEVIAHVVGGSIDGFKFEPHRPFEYHRIFFRIHVGKTAYDAFFNSPVGIRAQYCMDPENGLKQNRSLIEALRPFCLKAIRNKGGNAPLEVQASISLSGVDSKVWINDKDWPDSDEIHINYAPWVTKAKNTGEGTMTERAARTYAETGLLAPENTHIELKGAWLTRDNLEWRDPAKAQRAEEIRDYGFA